MTVSITFDPSIQSEVENAQEFLASVLTPNAVEPSKNATELLNRVAVDLLDRLGDRGRELLLAVARFDGRFTLADVAETTGDTIPQMRSRWANLGRSIAKTRSKFGGVVIFTEHAPSKETNGLYSFVMDEAIRRVVRQRKK